VICTKLMKISGQKNIKGYDGQNTEPELLNYE
jgi:hypothetical protein